ncbi:hypothetical protein ABFU82_13715 [Nocardioides sp. WV_118_6]
MPPYGPPSGPPPRRGPGRTLAWLAAGLVLVLLVLGAVALVVRNDSGDDGDSGSADGESGDVAREASCDAYRDVVQSSELWSAADADPDRLQEMYDAVLADIATAGDDEMAALVTDEATVVVSYYRALADWKQEMEDAVRRGEYPDTTVPTEITSQRGEITRTQGAVVEACP